MVCRGELSVCLSRLMMSPVKKKHPLGTCIGRARRRRIEGASLSGWRLFPYGRLQARLGWIPERRNVCANCRFGDEEWNDG